ncbi:MAG: hypothetical protein GX765_03370 [Candidatus Moranbacteria bacterium]|nr:hypothetical protein [Candidatus Moranbacteria bacterium]
MEKFKITVYDNSLLDKTILTKFNPIIVRKAHDDELTQKHWGNLIEIVVSLSDLNLVQKNMVHHFDGPEPWYTYGYSMKDNDKIVCAFGADDGNNGKVFIFSKNKDKNIYEDIIKYGEEKGIPKDVMNFLPLMNHPAAS